MEGWCEFFEACPQLGAGIVVSDMHQAGDGPLHFFVPVGDRGDAVRVRVCEEHARTLEALYGDAGR